MIYGMCHQWIINRQWRSVTFSKLLTVLRGGQNDISFKIGSWGDRVWTSLLWGEINESNRAWRRLSIPSTVCSRTRAAQRHLGCFHGEKKVRRRQLKRLTEEKLQTYLLPLNTRCHILGTNIEHTYIYELLIIYLIMRVRYVFHYLLAISDYGLQLVTDL